MTSFRRRLAAPVGLLALTLAACFPRVPDRGAGLTTWFPYTSGEGGQTDLWAVSIPGRQHHRLTSDVLAEAEPTRLDDGRVVYASHETGRWQLKIVDPRPAARSAPEPLYEGGQADDFAPVASPSGQVVFVSNRSGRRQIFAVLPGQAKAKLLTPQAGECDNPAVGPDGTIAFVRLHEGSRQVWQMDGDGGSPRRLTDLPIAMADLAALPANQVPPPSQLRHAVMMPSPPPGQAFQQVLRTQILFVGHRSGAQRSPMQAGGKDMEIFRFDPATTRTLNLTNANGNDRFPVVLPSGLIAFTTDRRGRDEIWTMDAWGEHANPWISLPTWARTR